MVFDPLIFDPLVFDTGAGSGAAQTIARGLDGGFECRLDGGFEESNMVSLVRNQNYQSAFLNVTDAAGEPVTGLAHTDVTLKFKTGDAGAVTTATLVALAAHDDPWVEDGWAEVGNGLYRYCVRQAVISNPTADYVHIWINCTELGARWIHKETEIVDDLQTNAALQAEVVVADWSPDALAAIFDEVDVETGYNLRETLRLVLSAAAAKLTAPAPGASGTVTIRDIGDTKPRITMPVDANGQRIGPAAYDAS